METTEKIVEAYCRHIKNFFTISNVKVGNDEIDLLAMDASKKTILKRYHIETSISISKNFSKLTAEKFNEEDYKTYKKAQQRRTMGFFLTKKFKAKDHAEKLKEFGFEEENYTKVIVSWGWTDEAKKIADKNKIELWDFRRILKEIAEVTKKQRSYFKDDTLRTLQLYVKSM